MSVRLAQQNLLNSTKRDFLTSPRPLPKNPKKSSLTVFSQEDVKFTIELCIPHFMSFRISIFKPCFFRLNQNSLPIIHLQTHDFLKRIQLKAMMKRFQMNSDIVSSRFSILLTLFLFIFLGSAASSISPNHMINSDEPWIKVQSFQEQPQLSFSNINVRSPFVSSQNIENPKQFSEPAKKEKLQFIMNEVENTTLRRIKKHEDKQDVNVLEGSPSNESANSQQSLISLLSSIQMPNIGGEQLRQAQKLRKLSEEITASTENLEKEEYDFYQNKYQIDSYKEIPFCVVIPTFNNVAQNRYLRNINSVVYQNYSNFHIVVIDDGSYDQTGELIIDFLQKQLAVPKERYTVIKNQKQMKAMHNLRTAALNHCAPEEIFLIVDGDDELIGRQVLKLFNAYFQITQAWFVYSNFLLRWIEPGFSRPFPERVIKSNAYRSYPFVTSHLRAFYTALFRNIRQSDLRDERGEYYSAANDVAICIPVLQQAHTKVAYLPQVTYYYNSDTGQNNHYVRALQQKRNELKIRRKQEYKPLSTLF